MNIRSFRSKLGIEKKLMLQTGLVARKHRYMFGMTDDMHVVILPTGGVYVESVH